MLKWEGYKHKFKSMIPLWKQLYLFRNDRKKYFDSVEETKQR